MKTIQPIILCLGIICCIPGVRGQDKFRNTDSLHTSLSLNYSGGGMYGKNASFGYEQRLLPSYNLRIKKVELGLGLDYYSSYYRWIAEIRKEKYLGLSPYLRYYIGKHRYFFTEAYMDAGYYWSDGMDPSATHGFQTSFGIGIGTRIHVKALDQYPFWRKVDFTVNLRQNLTNLSNPLGNTYIMIGMIYNVTE